MKASVHRRCGCRDPETRPPLGQKWACELYVKPGAGHLRFVELRDRHLQDLVTARTRINQPRPGAEKPSEMLRRLIAVRTDDTRKMLLGSETRRKKSTKALSPARIEREFAVIRAALNDAIPSKLLVNPFDGVALPRVDKADRNAALDRQLDAAVRATAIVLYGPRLRQSVTAGQAIPPAGGGMACASGGLGFYWARARTTASVYSSVSSTAASATLVSCSGLDPLAGSAAASL